jgi:glyoxylase-like metal-dependent hydrolase (beta-lactamase superfamily II)
MQVQAFFDEQTSTLTYLVYDRNTGDAVLIDPVHDFNPRRVSLSEASMDRVQAYVIEHQLTVHLSLETHVHADHLSGAQLARDRFGCKLVAGAAIPDVQAVFADIFNLDVPIDGSAFDHLLADGESLTVGSITVQAIATPGHTPACTTYRIADMLFTGDTLFMPDFGTGRCDFPKGDAGVLWDSVQRLYALPPETRVFVGHDYQPGGRELRYETTIGESRASNKHLQADTSRDAFEAFRTTRDATLDVPALILQSVQINLEAGKLPEPEANGRRYVKMPIGLFD